MRRDFRIALEKEFAQDGLTFAAGGQISLDAYPKGWDKTFCLPFIENEFKVRNFFLIEPAF